MVTGSYLSIITLNINGLNAPTKRQRLAKWIQKQDPSICCLQETHLKTRDTYRLKVKGWKKIFHANRDQKKAGVAILISDKIDFKTKAVKRDKEGHYIMIKGPIQEEDITIINIYALNTGVPQCIQKILTAQITVPSKDLIQIRRRNQKLYRQANTERIQHHQTSSPTNAKGSSLDRKHKKDV